VTGRAEIMDAPAVGAIGGTFGGNPVACAAALGVFAAFRDGSLLANARRLGERIHSDLRELQEVHPHIGDVRGLGPMQAVELVTDRKSKKPYPELAKKIVQHCYENGLILMSSGTHGNVIRLLVPLSMSLSELDEGLSVLKTALTTVGQP